MGHERSSDAANIYVRLWLWSFMTLVISVVGTYTMRASSLRNTVDFHPEGQVPAYFKTQSLEQDEFASNNSIDRGALTEVIETCD